MPELPEVETIARFLREGGRDILPIPGKTITRAELLWRRTLADPGEEEFCARLAGQRVEGTGRRAKFLLVRLSRDTLIVHLRMSGDLRVEPDAVPLQKHDRLAIYFSDGTHLAFNDTRKFGRVWLAGDPQSVLGGLGPEPLDPALSAEEFSAMLKRKNRQLKPLLMDQGFLAGLGNIYTDEALFLAKLHPLLPSGQVSAEQAARLLEAIRAVLREGIRRNGASIDWVYRGGDFQNAFRAYQRTGEPCEVCGTPIERIVVGQRSTHFCPRCQKM